MSPSPGGVRTVLSAPKVRISQTFLPLVDNSISPYSLTTSRLRPVPTHPSGLGQTASLSELSLVLLPSPHLVFFFLPCSLPTFFYYSKHILLCVVYISIHSLRPECAIVIETVAVESGQALGLSPSFLMCDLRQLLALPTPQFHFHV